LDCQGSVTGTADGYFDYNLDGIEPVCKGIVSIKSKTRKRLTPL